MLDDSCFAQTITNSHDKEAQSHRTGHSRDQQPCEEQLSKTNFEIQPESCCDSFGQNEKLEKPDKRRLSEERPTPVLGSRRSPSSPNHLHHQHYRNSKSPRKPQSNLYERIAWDTHRREKKLDALRHQQDIKARLQDPDHYNPSFRPKINPVSHQLTRAKGAFLQRQDRWNSKRLQK